MGTLILRWGRPAPADKASQTRGPGTRGRAERALESMRYDRLRELSDDPWRDMERGETERPAEVELDRLGLRRAAP